MPIESSVEFSQTYEMISGSLTYRMQSGRAIKQTHFKKIKTVLTGKGWMPTGLDGLDYSKPLLLKCATPLSVSNKNNQIVLPPGHRTDTYYFPKGFGLVNGYMIETKLIIEGSLATLEHVKSAKLYQVHYYPEILVFAEPPQVHGNVTSAEFSWSLTCEEV